MRYDLSVLDLLPVTAGTTGAQAVQRSLDLARLAEELGFVRYWVAEHHGMPAVASAAPEVLLARVGALTERIRVGSGGVMLPNHAPLRVAEAFRTLEALYPGRVDLGLGRAPGSDARASRALGAVSGERFGPMLMEMVGLAEGTLQASHPHAGVVVMPDGVQLPPIWILGSSGASAAAAGDAGMGYAFASHFSPAPAEPALRRYREAFQPSSRFPRPHAILGVSVVCAPTDEQAQRLAASGDLFALRLARGDLQPLPTPEEALAYEYSEDERALVAENRARHVIGTAEHVAARLDALAAETGADELMVVSNVTNHQARLQGYRLLVEALRERSTGAADPIR